MLHKDIIKTFKKKGNWIFPDYKRYCISNIPSTISRILGVETERPFIPIYRRTDKVLLFVFDGFGFNQWENFNHPIRKAFENSGDAYPITTVFPSSTASAMTSFHTGLTPQEHGILEWYMYFKEIDMILMTLPFNSEFEPKKFKKINPDPKILLQTETFYQRLSKNGIKPYVFIGKKISKGAYSDIVFKGAKVIGCKNTNQLFSKLKKIINKKEKAYYFVYWPDIDTLSHYHGPFHKSVKRKKIYVFNKMERLIKNIDEETATEITIMVSADHGQAKVYPKKTVFLNGYAWFENNLARSSDRRTIEPYGLPRDMFLQIKQGKLEEIKKNIEKLNLETIDVEEGIKQGLFGLNKPTKKFIDRAGDLLVLPRNGMVWYKHTPKEEVNFNGIHGGLTKDEMIVPLAIANWRDLKKKLKA